MEENVLVVVILAIIIVSVGALCALLLFTQSDTVTTTVLNITPFQDQFNPGYKIETTNGTFFSQHAFQIPSQPTKIWWSRAPFHDERWIQSIKLCYETRCHTEYMYSGY